MIKNFSSGLGRHLLPTYHDKCSTVEQVIEYIIISSLPKGRSLASKFSRFSAFLFISQYVSSNTSSIMPILGLPLGLFPSIHPSSTNFIRPSPLTTCPIQFFFLSHIEIGRAHI